MDLNQEMCPGTRVPVRQQNFFFLMSGVAEGRKVAQVTREN